MKQPTNIRRDMRMDRTLDLRISNVIKFFQAKGDKNFCFSKFAREALKKEVERVEAIIKDI